MSVASKVARRVAVIVARDERIEDAIDALGTARFPRGAVRAGFVFATVVGHRIDQVAGKSGHAVTGEAVEREILVRAARTEA